jgi:protein ImuB
LPLTHGDSITSQALLRLALEFSPIVEQTSVNTVVFPVEPLFKLFGTPHRIASEVGRYGHELHIVASFSMADNPDTAVLVARHSSGVTFVFNGREAEALANIPLADLFTHDLPIDPMLLDVLERWGLKTCEDLAMLPEHGVAERLGAAGLYLRDLALGKVNRPLRIAQDTISYEEGMNLDYTIDTLEPLLFLFGRTLSELCGRLRSQSQAARILRTRLLLASLADSEAEPDPNQKREFVCELEFPVPLDESRTMLKLLQLHLERHGPDAPVIGFVLQIDPTAPRRVQGGLFLPPAPQPDKLQVTLARIAGMVGEENVGSPELLNTHRADAFRMRPTVVTGGAPTERVGSLPQHNSSLLRLAIRVFRPALYARVRVAGIVPKQVIAAGVEGEVVESAGPWRTSGDWWTETPWARDEWDVELNDGALYRIYCESKTREWYVHAVYD